jgi:hypothetical protein
MHNFIHCFVRSGPGAWRCISPARIDLPSGSIEVATGSVLTKGTTFMNVDLVELLESEYRQGLKQH